MVGVIIGVLVVFAVVGLLIRYAPSPRKISEQERLHRITTERLCATLLAADDNPMYVIPPKAIELAFQLTNSKELNP